MLREQYLLVKLLASSCTVFPLDIVEVVAQNMFISLMAVDRDQTGASMEE